MLPLEAAPSGGPSLLLRPLYSSRLARSHVLELPAAELVQLAIGTDTAGRFNTARGHLHDTSRTLALERLAREAPEDFGLIEWITLGADTLRPADVAGHFAQHFWLHGAEIINGYQRLLAAAVALEELGPGHLAKTLLRVEVFCGAERDRARELHGRADQYLNVRTAQDRLVYHPNIRRLAEADWEGITFEPRRGVTTGPAAESCSMAEMTRALACLSGPGPELAHLAATAAGLAEIWDDHRSAACLSLFHSRMTPVGVMRAVEARRAAQHALAEIPKNRQHGHGLLIKYAPELIYWAACRVLPWSSLHEDRPRFDWDDALDRRIREETKAVAYRLIDRYEELLPKKGGYISTAPELSLWQALAEGC